MVYPDSMKVDPIIYQLQKEHEEIVKLHSYNPGEKFTEIARQYYVDKHEQRERELKKLRRGGPILEIKRENYLPTKSVKKRMDSEHLNSWMKHGEIQEVAERYARFQEMLGKMKPEQIAALKAANKETKEAFNRTMPNQPARLRSAA